MANQEQIDILKKGVKAWNAWREENADAKINLSYINLSGTRLTEANLEGANLTQTYLIQSDLSRANLTGANLSKSDLSESNFTGADIRESILTGADFTKVNLHGADFTKSDLRNSCFLSADLTNANLINVNALSINLVGANLAGANLAGADLTGANLIESNLKGANLWGSNLNDAKIGDTIFAKNYLSETIGLGEVRHNSSSTLGIDTIQFSKGKIPEAFLRGCGLADWEIESAKLYNPDLTNQEIVKIQYRIYDLRATQAIQISPLFISYSHTDSAFVDTLEQGLNAKGVRFWRDIHDMTAGKIETQIDRAIRQNPTVLLILSKNSMSSDWVQHEVRKARELEKELGRDTLCPIALDDGWKSSRWPQRVMEQVTEYNILDFFNWEDEAIFNYKFAKLLSGLDLFYKKPEK